MLQHAHSHTGVVCEHGHHSVTNEESVLLPFSAPVKRRHIARFLRSVIIDIHTKSLVGMAALTACVAVWVHSVAFEDSSIALHAVGTRLTANVLGMAQSVVAIWAASQRPDAEFSFGYDRVSVLAAFTSSLLVLLSVSFILKEGIEMLVEPVGVVTYAVVSFSPIWKDDLFFAATIALFTDLGGVAILGQQPGADELFGQMRWSRLPEWGTKRRAFGAAIFSFLIFVVNLAIYSLLGIACVDVVAALFIASQSVTRVFPALRANALLLLQTAPAELVNELERHLREVSTFDGVLEVHNEHFWAIANGKMAGSLHVRIRRDANEQAVLAQVIQKFAPLVPRAHLTIQVSKEDWNRRV